MSGLVCKMKRKEGNLVWQEIQNNFAEKNAVAVVLLDEKGRLLLSSNNNSICEHLLQSEYAAECAKFCGKAHEFACEKTAYIKCHANLNFLAIPVSTSKRRLTTILGRAFLKTDEYLHASKRAATGDWSDKFSVNMFSNVHFAGSRLELEKLADDFLKLVEKEKTALEEYLTLITSSEQETSASSDVSSSTESSLAEAEEKLSFEAEASDEATSEDLKLLESKIDAYFWRKIFNSLTEMDYKKACEWILQFLSEKFGLVDMAIFQAQEYSFRKVSAKGKFSEKKFQLYLSPGDRRIFDALSKGEALEMVASEKAERAWFFPIVVADRVQHGLLIGEKDLSEEIRNRIIKFCHKISNQLEILRLRYELDRQTFLANMVRKFNETLGRAKHIDIWRYFAQFCSEAMQSERCSLLFYDEKSGKFSLKFASGQNVEVLQQEKNLGSRIAYRVFEEGRPLVVSDLVSAGITSASKERNYKSESFISFPVIIGGKKVGVLNITDRSDLGEYDEFDLEVLKSIVSQISVAIERAAFMDKAGEYEQLSITDTLTELNNRRYLEARLDEEIKRSRRTGSPLAFLMIDVDDFKHYNDTFGHTEGDKVLKLLARIIRETLRGSDVAARYGGEEFSVLLPQTTLREAQATAERIRRRVEQTHFPNRRVTVSIGIATCRLDCNALQLVSSADKALYEAKRKGKNRVEVFAGSY